MATHSSVLSGESQAWGSLVGCHLWGCTELDMTEATLQQQQQTHQLNASSCQKDVMLMERQPIVC